MAPVICMPDLPRGDAACDYARRRPRSRVGATGGKHRTAELRQISIAKTRSESSYNLPPASPVSAQDSPNTCFPNSPESSHCARITMDRDDRWIIAKRRQGLLNIVARTIELVRKNHILEKKLQALRLETQSFIESVLNNPENKDNDRRQKPMDCTIKIEDANVRNVVSSSTNGSRDSGRSWSTRDSADNVDESRRIVCADQTAVTSTFNSMRTKPRTRSSNTLVH